MLHKVLGLSLVTNLVIVLIIFKSFLDVEMSPSPPGSIGVSFGPRYINQAWSGSTVDLNHLLPKCLPFAWECSPTSNSICCPDLWGPFGPMFD